jgi:hypothetical protein
VVQEGEGAQPRNGDISSLLYFLAAFVLACFCGWLKNGCLHRPGNYANFHVVVLLSVVEKVKQPNMYRNGISLSLTVKGSRPLRAVCFERYAYHGAINVSELS